MFHFWILFLFSFLIWTSLLIVVIAKMSLHPPCHGWQQPKKLCNHEFAPFITKLGHSGEEWREDAHRTTTHYANESSIIRCWMTLLQAYALNETIIIKHIACEEHSWFQSHLKRISENQIMNTTFFRLKCILSKTGNSLSENSSYVLIRWGGSVLFLKNYNLHGSH